MSYSVVSRDRLPWRRWPRTFSSATGIPNSTIREPVKPHRTEVPLASSRFSFGIASKSARQGHCLPPTREDLPDNGNRLLPQLPRYRSRTGYLLLPGRFLWRSARFLQGYPVIQEPPLFQECDQIRHLRQRDIFFESLGHKRGLVRTNQLDVAP